MKRVAVVLAGSGVYDGSEIHEASAVLVALSRNKINYQCFAPNINQAHVIDHTKGAVMEEKRNVLVESARIARGKIQSLEELKISDYHGVVIPGGFGAAKNLSTFAIDGPEKMTVHQIVEKILKEFHAESKPIGMCCIAPIIAAKIFENVTLTLGSTEENNGEWPFAGAAQAVSNVLKNNHQNCNISEVCVDEKNKIITAPAFMNDQAPIHEIHDNVTKMIDTFSKQL